MAALRILVIFFSCICVLYSSVNLRCNGYIPNFLNERYNSNGTDDFCSAVEGVRHDSDARCLIHPAWDAIPGSKLTPVISWIEMGLDLFFIWFRYSIGAWRLRDQLDSKKFE